MTEDPTDWIAVAALPKVGPASLCQLWQQDWTPARLLAASDSTLKAIGLPATARAAIAQFQLGQGPLRQRIDQLQAWLAAGDDRHLLTFSDPAYPSLLQQIPDPPPLLLLRGDPTALSLPQLAVVGSRHATRQGLRSAAAFARELSAAGFVITSGMALGVDGAAHQAVVERGGRTVAVFGTGPDLIYPARHRGLAERILAEGGVLVSEFWPGTPPKGGHFPRRNRIISGLCAGVLVVEAAPRSGSLITARLALEYNRELFAIPGTIHNPLSQGCHGLIRDGATLVQSTADIVEPLASLLGHCAEAAEASSRAIAEPMSLSNIELRLLNLMEHEQLSLDQLCALSGLPVAELGPLLTGLELKGAVEAAGSGYQRVVELP
ncbi:DNA-processing protein DprA [Marinobacterium arenosum]|uniref:DNA-processing protein DprA n=1 Tax=Marinobacterium arenosum TaxID=2862496 RepID=UPI001C952CA3|nr:DNA-processing protein DprA [Marinobacterium arenosum]MBY4677732.1 DNA-processing protein DprA [Marinobacterium arenosum]